MAWLHEHPYLAGGGVLALIVLFFLLRGGGAGGAQQSGGGATVAGPSDAVQIAGLQANAALAAGQNAATAQTNQLNAQVAATQIRANADVTEAGLAQQAALQKIVSDAQVSQQSIHATEDTTNYANATALQIVQAQTGGQVAIAHETAQRDTYIAGAQADTMRRQYDDAVASQRIISDAQTSQAEANAALQLGIAQSTNATQLGIAKEAGDVAINAANRAADIDFTKIVQGAATDQAAIKAQADMDFTHTVQSATVIQAGIAAQQSVDLATVGAYRDVNLADISATQAFRSQTLDVIGKAAGSDRSSTGIAQILSSLFGTQQPNQPQGTSVGISTPWGGGSVTVPG
jgi:hypothetical protein